MALRPWLNRVTKLISMLVIVVAVASCGPGRESQSASAAGQPTAVGSRAAPSPVPTRPVGTPSIQSSISSDDKPLGPPPGKEIDLAIEPGSSEARFRAREMLLGRSYLSEAIGSTGDVEGTLNLKPDGTVIPDGSEIRVNLASLKSDESERDTFIKQNTLETDKFPIATFAPTSGDLSLRGKGQTNVSFHLIGDLTLHGVTKSTDWLVSGDIGDDSVTGTALTTVSFEDFGMKPPSVPIVLSVDDTIRLEMSFRVSRPPSDDAEG